MTRPDGADLVGSGVQYLSNRIDAGVFACGSCAALSAAVRVGPGVCVRAADSRAVMIAFGDHEGRARWMMRVMSCASSWLNLWVKIFLRRVTGSCVN